MNYEKKYKEALERAKEEFYASNSFGKGTIEYIFPELKESEDEKIRKELIDIVAKSPITFAFEDKNKVLSWLEKQGEQKPTEPKFKVGDKIKTANEESLTITKIDKKGYWSKDLFICSFDEECIWDLAEQKPVDKVEPKFKIGDWIYHNNGYRGPYLITNINEHGVELDNNIRIKIEDCYDYHHLWTIQDAKDGDVLFMDNGSANCIFIYKSFNNGIINKYASYNNFGFEGEHYLVLNDGYVIPATKEQRDLLFQKMHEASYEWDSENKELKKIEKPVWSEEDGYNLQCMIAKVFSDIQNGNVGRNNELINWLKSIKTRVGYVDKWEPSEEQMKVLSFYADQNNSRGSILTSLLDDLKKLRNK